jgi:hypothetical protein
MRAATARMPAACTPVAGALLGACGLSGVLSVGASLSGGTPARALEPVVIAEHGTGRRLADTLAGGEGEGRCWEDARGPRPAASESRGSEKVGTPSGAV